MSQRPHPLHLLAAFGTGCLLTMMLFFNSELGRFGGPWFASWSAHGTGTLAGLVLVLLLFKRMDFPKILSAGPAPFWAYLGGFTGSVNVMLSSTAVNAGLALAGTMAVSLSGQMLFSLAADRWGFFGLPRRRPAWRDLGPVVLIISGSAIIILFGTGRAP
jgi:transporter family-2 protein